jgi:DNA-directed RNA polymerase specialized sigma24 family protein
MNKSNRSHAALDLFTDETDAAAESVTARADARVVLDAVVRAHRDLLVLTARQILGNFRQDAEDIVQDVCLVALEGDLEIAEDPAQALDALLGEVARRARAHRNGGQA